MRPIPSPDPAGPAAPGDAAGDLSSRVIVIGAGHAGLLGALGLDRLGLPVQLVETEPLGDLADRPFEGRALALMDGSRRVFQGLGLWDALKRYATPVVGVRVLDRGSGASARYDASDLGERPFGYGILNTELRRGLLDLVRDRPGIEIVSPARAVRLKRRGLQAELTLDNGRVLKAALVVGADGRNSAVRELAGIRVGRWPYRQAALTFAVRHERPHEQLVREYLRAAGPLALLPVGPRLTSITWIDTEERARWLALADPAEVARALRAEIGDVLGALAIEGPVRSYPLTAHLAVRAAAPRVALVGDAAHGIHPIHAQGFNLGVRDIAALLEIVSETRARGGDIGGSEPLVAYQRWRRSDTRLVSRMTDGLNLLFSNDLAPARLVRGWWLRTLDNVPPLKTAAMRRGMGVAGDLPRLARGEAL